MDWKELAIELATALRKLTYAASYRHDVNKALTTANSALHAYEQARSAEAKQRAANTKEETDGN